VFRSSSSSKKRNICISPLRRACTSTDLPRGHKNPPRRTDTIGRSFSWAILIRGRARVPGKLARLVADRTAAHVPSIVTRHDPRTEPVATSSGFDRTEEPAPTADRVRKTRTGPARTTLSSTSGKPCAQTNATAVNSPSRRSPTVERHLVFSGRDFRFPDPRGQ